MRGERWLFKSEICPSLSVLAQAEWPRKAGGEVPAKQTEEGTKHDTEMV